MKSNFAWVRYIPDLKQNLISIGMLDVEGCVVKINKGLVKITKGAMVLLMKESFVNSLYILDGKNYKIQMVM